MGNSSNSSNSSDSSDSEDKKEKKGKTNKKEKRKSSFSKKAKAFTMGMGEGYYKSQSEKNQQAQKYTAEYIGNAIGKYKYG